MHATDRSLEEFFFERERRTPLLELVILFNFETGRFLGLFLTRDRNFELNYNVSRPRHAQIRICGSNMADQFFFKWLDLNETAYSRFS